MRVIVSDSSALIDLQKGCLLELFIKLPYEFVIPDALLESELLSLSKKEKSAIRKRMRVLTLNGREVKEARAIVKEVPALSIFDGFALAISRKFPDSILLTGDKRMRLYAETRSIECHGVIWVVQELKKCDIGNSKILLNALHIWRTDPLVRLPLYEVDRLIKCFYEP